MRISSFLVLGLLTAMSLAPFTESAMACSCLPPPPEIKSARALAEWRANQVSTIFEGTAVDMELKSPLLQASVGSLVSANVDEITPVLQVNFSVSRWYRGARQSTLQVETGLGGGDCGFGFQMGKKYLVYAYKDDADRLSTGICTATASLEDSASNLAYLRGEAVIPSPTARPARGGSRLCTRIVKNKSASARDSDDRVSLFPVGSKSPIPSEELERDEKGNFCGKDIAPGDYHLAFREDDVDSPVSFLFYPGVVDTSQAETIRIKSGQSNPDLVFRVPSQSTFSVTGAVTTPNGSPLPAGVKVMLIHAEAPFLALVYDQDVAQDGKFSFAKVLPGRYWAFAVCDFDSAESGKAKWWTWKTEMKVDGNVSNVSLVMTR